MIRPPPTTTLFPYTTLFRSGDEAPRLVNLYGITETTVHVTVHCVRSADRKSTRLNSSHMSISYAVFCLKKKTKYFLTSNNVNNNEHHLYLSNTAKTPKKLSC